MRFISIVLGLLVVAATATAQVPADSARALPVVPNDAELVLAVDCRAIYNDPTFDAVMDLVEASESYTENAGTLAAWGFDPRADVQELVFAVENLGDASSEFVIVAAGELSAAEVNLQLSQRTEVTAVSDERGSYWAFGDSLHYLVTDAVAIAGRGEMFAHARSAVLNGSTQAWRGQEQAIQLNIAVDEELRAAHPALGAYLVDLVVSLQLGREPTFRVRAETPSPEAASSALSEVVQVLQAVLDVPEVSAMGLNGLLENADVTTDGSTVNVVAVLDAESWLTFSDTLSELVAEELR